MSGVLQTISNNDKKTVEFNQDDLVKDFKDLLTSNNTLSFAYDSDEDEDDYDFKEVKQKKFKTNEYKNELKKISEKFKIEEEEIEIPFFNKILEDGENMTIFFTTEASYVRKVENLYNKEKANLEEMKKNIEIEEKKNLEKRRKILEEEERKNRNNEYIVATLLSKDDFDEDGNLRINDTTFTFNHLSMHDINDIRSTDLNIGTINELFANKYSIPEVFLANDDVMILLKEKCSLIIATCLVKLFDSLENEDEFSLNDGNVFLNEINLNKLRDNFDIFSKQNKITDSDYEILLNLFKKTIGFLKTIMNGISEEKFEQDFKDYFSKNQILFNKILNEDIRDLIQFCENKFFLDDKYFRSLQNKNENSDPISWDPYIKNDLQKISEIANSGKPLFLSICPNIINYDDCSAINDGCGKGRSYNKNTFSCLHPHPEKIFEGLPKKHRTRWKKYFVLDPKYEDEFGFYDPFLCPLIKESIDNWMKEKHPNENMYYIDMTNIYYIDWNYINIGKYTGTDMSVHQYTVSKTEEDSLSTSECEIVENVAVEDDSNSYVDDANTEKNSNVQDLTLSENRATSTTLKHTIDFFDNFSTENNKFSSKVLSSKIKPGKSFRDVIGVKKEKKLIREICYEFKKSGFCTGEDCNMLHPKELSFETNESEFNSFKKINQNFPTVCTYGHYLSFYNVPRKLCHYGIECTNTRCNYIHEK